MNRHNSTFLKNTDAVSEIIGEVLMTAIAVLAFSVITVFIFSYATPLEKVHADIQGWVDVDSDTIYLRHAGGERVDIPEVRLLLDINNTRRELSSSELEQIKQSATWDLGEIIRINASQLWSYNIGQDDYVAIALITTNSNLVIKSGTLLGDSMNVIPSGNTSAPTPSPTAPVLSGQNPLTPYQSNTSQSVTFNAISSQSSINEFLLNGQHFAWSNGTSPSYTNTSASEGTYTVTLIAKNNTNPLLTDSLTWTWTVVSDTSAPVPGVNMRLQKSYKGGYIADGNYIQFKTGGGGSSITIDGVPTSIPNNRNVMLVMNGHQTSGESDISISGSSRKITTYDFNVKFYMNGVLTDTGDITSIFISKADNFESTLSYYLPADLSQTYFTENGGSNVLIGWYPPNGSEIRLYDIRPSNGIDFRLEFDPGYTYINGFDANYTIG
nr:type IV pilin [Methanolobus psychrotolerans]